MSAKEACELFLSKCQQSSQHSYEQLKSLLSQLEAPKSTKNARVLLSEIQQQLAQLSRQEVLEKYHFSLISLETKQYGQPEEYLHLIQLPSVFDPEVWSYTFFEGITRYASSEFYGKHMTELGCGNGWVTLAIAKRYLPEKIYGFDINPKAITSAKLNLYLNGMSETGEWILDSEGKSLYDRVYFEESDLLGYLFDHQIEVDRIVGCIPQVLSPDPELTVKAISDHASDEDLHALSNYCGKQGYLEDQFGLGLIARTLEEAVELLRPSGKVILNLGGRPGNKVLEKLFLRRGYHVQPVWQTKVPQAEDTDIQSLVEIEKQSSHRFEFYMNPTSNVAVSAKTAEAYLKAGGSIAHSLNVYEARVNYPEFLKNVFSLLKQPGYEEIKPTLDLNFDDQQIAQEKMSFLASLATRFSHLEHFPYEGMAGSSDFRRRIAEYLQSYFLLPITSQHIVIYPSLLNGIKNIALLYRQGRILIDSEWSHALPESWMEASEGSQNMPEVIEIPRHTHMTCELIESLQPQMAFVCMSDYEYQTPDAFIRLLEISKKYHTRLFIDISNVFEIYSSPAPLGIFQYLQQTTLPPHCTILCGLIKDKVYPDLEVAFSISENQSFNEAMSNMAELTYSRVPLITQYYFDQILLDLLGFQMDIFRNQRVPQTRPLLPEPIEFQKSFVTPHSLVKQAFQHPCIEALALPFTPETIRLDYGENALSSPLSLKSQIFASFAQQATPRTDEELDHEVLKALSIRFGGMIQGSEKVVYGNGVASLFFSLAESCLTEGGSFIFPSGCYGEFVAVCELLGVPTKVLNTSSTNEYKITPSALISILKETPNAWVYLNAPILNPTGGIYTAEEFYPLLSVAQKHGATLIVDSIFAGLEFDGSQPLHISTNFWKHHLGLLSHAPLEVVLLGGVSKEFSGAGVRFGYGATQSKRLYKALRTGVLSEPHSTVKYAISQMLQQGTRLKEGQKELQQTINTHQQQLCKTLERTGWSTIQPEGGLFLIARPDAYFGKKLTFSTPDGKKEITLDSENIAEAMFYTVDTLINNSVWTGIPEYCRFCYAIDTKIFQNGLEKIVEFYEVVQQENAKN